MSRFNVTTRQVLNTPTTTNLSGGSAYNISEKEELVSAIVTSFTADTFYESWLRRSSRLEGLIAKYPALAVKSAIFARRVMNMRSISHWVIAKCAKIHGALTRQSVAQVIVRPDDCLEILALTGAKRLPQALKKGIADRLGEFNEYQLAKYLNAGKEWNLNDVVRLCHPKPTPALEGLVYRTIKNTETWEAMGNSAETWFALLREGKLGYMALLKNLRNIINFGNRELIDLTCKALVNYDAIRKSRVLPFRYLTAIKIVKDLDALGDGIGRKVLHSLSEAMSLALDNVPDLEGVTAVLIDGSGSMYDGINKQTSRADMACLFGAALTIKNQALPIIYSTNAVKADRPVSDNLYDTFASFREQLPMQSTSLMRALVLAKYYHEELIQRAGRGFDRIINLTDEESNVGQADISWFHGQLWTFNFAGYGTGEFHSRRARTVYGFSDAVLDIIPQIESGGIVKYVEDYNLEWES